jgi:hypothetical protein
MPVTIRETEALRLASMLTQLLSLKDGALPADLDAEEIALVVNHRRKNLLKDIENLGVQVRPDLPKQEVVTPQDEPPPQSYAERAEGIPAVKELFAAADEVFDPALYESQAWRNT